MRSLAPESPVSATTGAGWAMIFLGVGVGFLFAVLVLGIGVVSFPLLLDRDVGVERRSGHRCAPYPRTLCQ